MSLGILAIAEGLPNQEMSNRYTLDRKMEVKLFVGRWDSIYDKS
jgi:hypothetical protein